MHSASLFHLLLLVVALSQALHLPRTLYPSAAYPVAASIEDVVSDPEEVYKRDNSDQTMNVEIEKARPTPPPKKSAAPKVSPSAKVPATPKLSQPAAVPTSKAAAASPSQHGKSAKAIITLPLETVILTCVGHDGENICSEGNNVCGKVGKVYGKVCSNICSKIYGKVYSKVYGNFHGKVYTKVYGKVCSKNYSQELCRIDREDLYSYSIDNKRSVQKETSLGYLGSSGSVG